MAGSKAVPDGRRLVAVNLPEARVEWMQGWADASNWAVISAGLKLLAEQPKKEVAELVLSEMSEDATARTRAKLLENQ